MSESVDKALAHLPATPRRAAWRLRREISRRRRRGLEARGDWSRSAPAMYDLDRILEQRYLSLDGGFFVEAGAVDGYFQSNTYRLERKRGWKGVLVEPFPPLAAETARERPGSHVFNCALVGPAFTEATMTLKYRGAMTVVSRPLDNEGAEAAWTDWSGTQDEPEHEFTVPARTLTALLDEVSAPQIDFMSLDVEGYEGEVLLGLDLERHAPTLILVETDNDRRREQAVTEALRGRYREVERVTPVDVLFRRID